jgi:hypothetical protein
MQNQVIVFIVLRNSRHKTGVSMEGVKVPVLGQPTKFIDQFRAFIRLDGKSYATENTYVYWVRQYILFNQKRHPSTMGKSEVSAFLSHLSLVQNASPNTQKTALNAVYFCITVFFAETR